MTERLADAAEFEAQLDGVVAIPTFVRASPGVLTITRRDGHVERTLRMENVAEVTRTDDRVTIVPIRGAPVTLRCDRADELDATVVAACCAVPELTRALHSLGSSRARSDATAQREFFAPLLDARRRAEESVGRPDIVAAFDADRLQRAFESYLEALAERSADERPAARRAFSALVEDASSAMTRAIEDVRRTGPAATQPAAGARVTAWRAWSRSLHALFAAADGCWTYLERNALVSRRP